MVECFDWEGLETDLAEKIELINLGSILIALLIDTKSLNLFFTSKLNLFR